MVVDIPDIGPVVLTPREGAIYRQGIREGIAAMKEAMETTDPYDAWGTLQRAYAVRVTEEASDTLQRAGLLQLDHNPF
jgi:hypothetical protein